MKIAYLINGMFNSAGRERVVSSKATFLTQKGFEITIITTDQKGRPYYYDIPKSVKKVDFEINNENYAHLSLLKRVFAFLHNDKMFKKKLISFLECNPQDIIVTLEDRFIPVIVQVAYGKSHLLAESHFNKYAFDEIGKSVSRGFIQRVVYRIRALYIEKRYYSKLDRYVLLTYEDMGYRRNEIKNAVVIPNSISYDKSKVASLDNKVVIGVGRLSYQKGFERLIEAWRIVEKSNPEWSLHIYGNGEDKENLQALINKYELNNCIIIFPPTQDIEDRLLNSSIYVLSSRFEGLPMVLLEAMSLGLPIVSFDCKTGPKDLIKDGYNGYLVPEGNIEILADRILHLIQNENLRKTIGQNAKKEAAKYSHEIIVSQWESLFNQLMNSKK